MNMKKENSKINSADRSAWLITLIFIVLVTAFAIRFSQMLSQENDNQIDSSPNIEISELLNEQTCSEAGGNWNDCGSACRGADDETICIQVCMAYCECANSDQCPANFACGDFIDEIGICSLEN